MQDKKNQNILFTKDNSSKNRARLSKLLKKYPFSLNIQYKHLELNTLHDKVIDPVEVKRLSIFAIDKQFLKMKFKKLNSHKDSYWLNTEANQAVIQQRNEPKESEQIDSNLENESPIIEPNELNQSDDLTVEQGTDQQKIMMAAKKKDNKHADQDFQIAHFTEWLDGLKKSKKSKDSDEPSSKERKKKKKKKKKDKKLKAKKKQKEAEVISETLAELMAKQGYTDRAIEMYKRLSLLFPEKNSYFAGKIEDLNN